MMHLDPDFIFIPCSQQFYQLGLGWAESSKVEQTIQATVSSKNEQILTVVLQGLIWFKLSYEAKVMKLEI